MSLFISLLIESLPRKISISYSAVEACCEHFTKGTVPNNREPRSRSTHPHVLFCVTSRLWPEKKIPRAFSQAEATLHLRPSPRAHAGFVCSRIMGLTSREETTTSSVCVYLSACRLILVSKMALATPPPLTGLTRMAAELLVALPPCSSSCKAWSSRALPTARWRLVS